MNYRYRTPRNDPNIDESIERAISYEYELEPFEELLRLEDEYELLPGLSNHPKRRQYKEAGTAHKGDLEGWSVYRKV